MKEMKVVEGKVFAGDLWVKDKKFGIVVSRFNSLVTTPLLKGAIDGFVRHGGKQEDVTAVWVPGAFEIPQTVKVLVDSGKFHAVIGLGAVIRGATPHFDQVALGVTRGMADISLTAKIPVIFGVLTTDNLEQALERAGSKAGNKGFDAAMAAIEMGSVLDQLKKLG